LCTVNNISRIYPANKKEWKMKDFDEFLADTVSYFFFGVALAVAAIGAHIKGVPVIMFVAIPASGMLLFGATSAILHQASVNAIRCMIGFWPSNVLRRIIIGAGYAGILALFIKSVDLIRWSEQIVSWRSLLIAICAMLLGSIVAGILQGLHEAGTAEAITVGQAD